MKIKNTTVCNLSVGAVSTRGKAAKKYMVVPGEATLELEDELWKTEFAEPAAKMVEAGNLEIVEAPAKTQEEIEAEEAEELAKAEALVANKKEKTTAK